MEKIIKKLLENRGIDKEQDFFFPNVSDLADPFIIPGMKEACELLKKIIQEKRKVFIYGDGDVDGIFGTYILIKIFEKTDVPFVYYLTHRLENYEIDENLISDLKKENISAFISVDCGISSVKFLEKMCKENIKTIVIDHHIFDKNLLPENHIYINPKIYDVHPEIKFLSATALAHKLGKGLSYFIPLVIDENLELAAISTIADNCPLVGENRKIVKIGLEKIFSTEIDGLKEFMEELRIKEKKLIQEIRLKLIPKLNSPGRFGKPEVVLDLLLSNRPDSIIKEIKEIDRKRYNMTKKYLKKLKGRSTTETFIVEKGIMPTLCGILSSRLSAELNQPVAVCSEKEGIIQGSARSPEFYDLQKFIKHAKNFMISCGGHQNAIGFTFRSEFLDKINKIWEDFTSTKIEIFYYDAEIEIDKITPSFLEKINMMAPFGPGNPEPVFLAKCVKVEKIIRKSDEGLVFWIKKNEKLFECLIKENSADKKLAENRIINIYFTPKFRVNNGFYRIYFLIKKLE